MFTRHAPVARLKWKVRISFVSQKRDWKAETKQYLAQVVPGLLEPLHRLADIEVRWLCTARSKILLQLRWQGEIVCHGRQFDDLYVLCGTPIGDERVASGFS